jgi:hypothetical protein
MYFSDNHVLRTFRNLVLLMSMTAVSCERGRSNGFLFHQCLVSLTPKQSRCMRRAAVRYTLCGPELRHRALSEPETLRFNVQRRSGCPFSCPPNFLECGEARTTMIRPPVLYRWLFCCQSWWAGLPGLHPRSLHPRSLQRLHTAPAPAGEKTLASAPIHWVGSSVRGHSAVKPAFLFTINEHSSVQSLACPQVVSSILHLIRG